mmetsp:Transcript_110741/g.191970  ORF Transcript_110741/g.191970 Transcript_110741/m.191970 type:complete len:259 (+) Transcript_110741:580-1356(+)
MVLSASSVGGHSEVCAQQLRAPGLDAIPHTSYLSWGEDRVSDAALIGIIHMVVDWVKVGGIGARISASGTVCPTTPAQACRSLGRGVAHLIPTLAPVLERVIQPQPMANLMDQHQALPDHWELWTQDASPYHHPVELQFGVSDPGEGSVTPYMCGAPCSYAWKAPHIQHLAWVVWVVFVDCRRRQFDHTINFRKYRGIGSGWQGIVIVLFDCVRTETDTGAPEQSVGVIDHLVEIRIGLVVRIILVVDVPHNWDRHAG